MEYIIRRLEKSKKFEDLYIDIYCRGIMPVERELNDDDFNALMYYLNIKDDVRIGIVDSKKRAVKTEANHYVTASMWNEVDIPRTFLKHPVNKLEINILRAVPDYIVFRELISEQNIEDILHAMNSGHNVIAFTDLSKECLFQLTERIMNYSERTNNVIFKDFNNEIDMRDIKIERYELNENNI